MLWRGPTVEDADEAEVLLAEWHARRDDSYFEPSAALAAFADQLRAARPDVEARFAIADRLLCLRADEPGVVAELARDHGLVTFDAEAHEVHLPDEAARSSYSPPLGFATYFKTFLMLVAAVGVVVIGWVLPVPLLNWVLMIVGGFFTSVILFLFWCYWAGSRLPAEGTPGTS